MTWPVAGRVRKSGSQRRVRGEKGEEITQKRKGNGEERERKREQREIDGENERDGGDSRDTEQISENWGRGRVRVIRWQRQDG